MNQNTVTRSECQAWANWPACELFDALPTLRRLARAHLELLDKLTQKQAAFDDLVQGTAVMLDARTAERDELRSQKAALESQVEATIIDNRRLAEVSMKTIKALESQLEVSSANMRTVQAYAEKLDEQLAEARKDTERLDWMIRYRHDVIYWHDNGQFHIIVDELRSIGNSWREAIDAAGALRAKPGPRDWKASDPVWPPKA